MATLADRRLRALDQIPDDHLLPPYEGKPFAGAADAKERVQDYAFSEGFASVIHNHDKVRQILVLECTQHRSQTKNWRKIPLEERKRINTKVSANDCPFRLCITQKKDEDVWRIVKLCLDHNHSMNPDPFQFQEHKSRDPDFGKVLSHAIGLREAGTEYKQAQQILLTHNVRLPAETYWNLVRSSKLSPEEKIQVTLDTLEGKGFHLRCLKKYLVENNVRERQVIEAFLFCSPEQIEMARRFVSGFLIQTDATFNTNELNMPLSILLSVTNTMSSFPVAYTFISSESAEAFKFINAYCKELFFWDDCPGPAVMLGDFSLGLSAAMIKKAGISMMEAGMDQVYEMVNHLDALETDCTLQLCSWHAAEAVKARLIKEGYPKEIREAKDVGIHILIWNWIKSPTVNELNLDREILAASLRPKEQEYLYSYWQRQEPQFGRAYTRLLPNLGAESTQRSEASHPMIKNQTNKYTPIEVAVRKLRDVVVEMARTHTDTINRQRQNAPFLVNNKPAFKEIKRKIIHESLNLLLREWIAAGKLVEEIEKSDEPCPDIENDTCKLECALPIQFGLPCKCFLYHCLVRSEPISLTLIHPRWFLDGPLYIPENGWRMRFSDFRAENPMLFQEKKMESDRFQDHGMALLEESVMVSLDYARTLPVHEREEYAKAFKEFNAVFQARKTKQALVPTTFVDPIRPKDVRYKKGRRRGLTLREALEEEEADKRRRRRAASVEQAQLQRHLALTQDYAGQTNELGPFLQNSNPGFERQKEFLEDNFSDILDDNHDHASASILPTDDEMDEDSESDVQYLGTQAANFDDENSKDSPVHHYSSAPDKSNSDSDNLDNIDQRPSIPPRLISLSQNLTASQLPPSTAPVMTRTARGVTRKKTY